MASYECRYLLDLSGGGRIFGKQISYGVTNIRSLIRSSLSSIPNTWGFSIQILRIRRRNSSVGQYRLRAGDVYCYWEMTVFRTRAVRCEMK